MRDKNKIAGCLLGGAAGDALGYPIEFESEKKIFGNYGVNGIEVYDIDPEYGKAVISDDTQMTLFTAEGILQSEDPYNFDSAVRSIYEAYMAWLHTQFHPKDKVDEKIWLCGIPELNQRRAPGITCLNALMSGERGEVKKTINTSKGCGGVMRVAPIGLFYASDKQCIETTDRLGAAAAALTHGHPMGYLSAAGLVHIVNRAMYCAGMSLREIIMEMISYIPKLFPQIADCAKCAEKFGILMEAAVDLACNQPTVSDLEAIHILGKGWVGEEALAIAVFCALRHENDFGAAICSAANHSGDSDSTASITGNILGTYLGLQAIPQKFINDLELRDVIMKVAEELSDAE